MNPNADQFKPMKRFVNAVEQFHEALAVLAKDGNAYTDCVGYLREHAPAVVQGLDAMSAVVPFFATDEERADLAMVTMREQFARRAEREGDLMLAADERDACARMMVHVARRIVEARLGVVETPLTRQLRASTEIAASLPTVEERGAKFAEMTRRAFPSDFDLKARTFGEVVPLNGKAGA